MSTNGTKCGRHKHLKHICMHMPYGKETKDTCLFKPCSLQMRPLMIMFIELLEKILPILQNILGD